MILDNSIELLIDILLENINKRIINIIYNNFNFSIHISIILYFILKKKIKYLKLLWII